MDWLSIIPPIVAIAVVLWRKEVIVALVLAIFAAELLQMAFAWYSPGAATINTIERIVGVFNSPDNARLLVFKLGGDFHYEPLRDFIPLMLGFLFSFTVGYLALRILLGFIEQGRLHWWSWYCWSIGALALLWFGLPGK